jgi:REP element-mobilizing transposase RayT
MTQRRIYQCDLPYHITFNVLNREWFFEDEAKAKILYEIILNAGDIKNHTVYQFCIMPDHVHLLCKSNEKPATDYGLCGRKSIKNTADTEAGKNTADTEVPQCFLGEIGDFKNSSHGGVASADLRVRANDDEFFQIIRANDDEFFQIIRADDELGILLKPDNVPKTMTNFMHSIKSFFVREMREVFDVEYKFFQSRFNYRIITNDDQLHSVIAYITHNPIKAELPEKWERYPYQYKNDDLIQNLFI